MRRDAQLNSNIPHAAQQPCAKPLIITKKCKPEVPVCPICVYAPEGRSYKETAHAQSSVLPCSLSFSNHTSCSDSEAALINSQSKAHTYKMLIMCLNPRADN